MVSVCGNEFDSTRLDNPFDDNFSMHRERWIHYETRPRRETSQRIGDTVTSSPLADKWVMAAWHFAFIEDYWIDFLPISLRQRERIGDERTAVRQLIHSFWTTGRTTSFMPERWGRLSAKIPTVPISTRACQCYRLGLGITWTTRTRNALRLCDFAVFAETRLAIWLRPGRVTWGTSTISRQCKFDV